MYLADAGNHRIQNLSARSGSFYNEIGGQGIQAGQFNNPKGICYDIDRDQFIAVDTGNNRIQIFQLNSLEEYGNDSITFIKQIADQGLSSPSGVVCRSDETSQMLYVADTGNNRVVKLKVENDIAGSSPPGTMEVFKGALLTDDVGSAAKLFSIQVESDYQALLEYLRPYFQDIVNDMEQMIPVSKDHSSAVYDLIREEDGTSYGYPVFFVKDEQGNWKIYSF